MRYKVGMRYSRYNEAVAEFKKALVQDADTVDLQDLWGLVVLYGKQVSRYVTDSKKVPRLMSAKVERACQLFNQASRAPRNPRTWWAKNKGNIAALGMTQEFEDLTPVKIGMFNVYNTTGASAQGIEMAAQEATDLLSKAASSVHRLQEVLNPCKLYIVGNIQSKRNLGTYSYEYDKINLRWFKSSPVRYVETIAHEVGHRYYSKAGEEDRKSEWAQYHEAIKNTKVQKLEALPCIGEDVPFYRYKGCPITVYRKAGSTMLCRGVGGARFKVTADQLRAKLAIQDKNDLFPTPYSRKNEEEHFCESLSLYTCGKLPERFVGPFLKVWS